MSVEGDYGAAVYLAETEALTAAIVKVIKGCETENPPRLAVVTAALVTAMMVVDGNDMPRQSRVMLLNGIAHRVHDALWPVKVVEKL